MPPKKQTDHPEQGVDIPIDRIDPDTLHNMIREFVSREWADLSDSGCTLEEKIGQVLRQLQENRVKVVYDLATETWNIVVRT